MQRRLSCLMKKLNLNEETVSALLMRSFPDFQRWMAGKEHGNDDYNDNDDDIEARVEFFLMSNALEDLVQQKDIAYTSLPVDALLVRSNGIVQSGMHHAKATETKPARQSKRKSTRAVKLELIDDRSPIDAKEYLTRGLMNLRNQMKTQHGRRAMDRGAWSMDIRGKWTRIAPRSHTRQSATPALGRRCDQLMATTDPLRPIRIDFQVGLDRRIQETILWNVDANETTPIQFAAITAAELKLSPTFQNSIAASICQQLDQQSAKIPRYQCEDRLHPICIHIQIDGLLVQDQFEWNINDDSNSPEHFALVMCRDLQLPAAFHAAIALSIREQVHFYRRVIFGGTKTDQPVWAMPRLEHAVRLPLECDQWGPTLTHVNGTLDAPAVGTAPLPSASHEPPPKPARRRIPFSIKPTTAFSIYSKRQRSDPSTVSTSVRAIQKAWRHLSNEARELC
ncbi:hypothetical protein, variant [Aphanomyces astaci]|uniref:HMG box domain-containing protein n=1 Tax=Aphanomyces astaci TaxID=112090 RepID=W4G677_APHAT|nr:hypothetical protein, variant [Aphanomyces astaci]ETV74791.1 hypothetical protein, variant [Aphanomyces astaci]|eukprot:XP_009835878.1 hypothetical protein, variant [Aphanomyces astaci]